MQKTYNLKRHADYTMFKMNYLIHITTAMVFLRFIELFLIENFN